MAMQFERLFTPIKIRNRTVKNRLVFPCHGSRMPFFRDESDGSQYLEYYRARAKGGCGMLVMGSIVPHISGARAGLLKPPTPEILAPKLKKMADAIHEHGAVVVCQMWLRGNGSESVENIHANWGFTARPSEDGRREICHEMTDSEIEEIIDSFVLYARVCKEGGLDGVELHGCHGSLLQQSFSTWNNQRTDKWGQQMAFASELASRVRAAVGQDFVVSIRIPSDDFHPGGMDNEAMKKVAQALEATGKLDYISLTQGSRGSHYAWVMGSMYVPPAAWIPLASGIKQALKSIPTIAAGRINEPALAESVLADGHADMVGVCRGQIADPEFANKAREGRLDDIRLCIACNQGCADRNFRAYTITCLQNAAVGKEKKLGTIALAPKKKKVVVVGGGPGGMEAARVAAIRGHDVTLFEKENQLGGQINTLSKAPGREEFSQATRFLTTQIAKLKVKVRLGVEATVETLKQEQPDVVIIATGSRHYVPSVPGSDQPNVLTPSQVLDGAATVGERVVVYDDVGIMEGVTLPDYLADQGKKVEAVTPFNQVGANIGYTHQPLIWPRLRQKGVVFTPFTALRKISGRTLTVSDVNSEEERTIDNVDTVVLCTNYRAKDSLFRSLQGQVKELYVVGDANAPRRAMDAIHDAYNLAFNT